jgi:hypothetical protein
MPCCSATAQAAPRATHPSRVRPVVLPCTLPGIPEALSGSTIRAAAWSAAVPAAITSLIEGVLHDIMRTMPCRSSCMAAVWRSTCGVTRFRFSDGQRSSALRWWRATSRSTASRLSGPPRLLGNAGVGARAGHFRNHSARTATTSWRSGVQRSFLPLPSQRRCAPVPRT